MKEIQQRHHKLLILYATQTGNALDAAERLAREAERRACPINLLSLHQYDPNLLPQEEAVVFVVSTTGQGDTPDSMKVFWRFLLQRSLSQHWLKGVHYTVFGLGDSGYQKYNFVAKKLDKRLKDLGGTTILERGLGDDQHPSGYEGTLDPWMSSLWRILNTIKPEFLPNGPDVSIQDTVLIDQPKVQITYHNIESHFSTASDTGSVRSMHPGKSSSDKSGHPDCFLKMVKNLPLTRPNCGKDVRHFEFELESHAIKYDTGDVLEILPGQDSAEVDAFIRRCDLDPDAFISISPRGTDDCNGHGSRIPIQLKTFVELTMDVASASPRRYFFEVMSFFATAEHEKERLQYFSSPEGRDDLYQYNQKERRTVLEVLEDFPSVQMPLEWLIQLVPMLKTRAFSISSSQSVHPNQVHLTVSVVSWTTPYKRKKKGLCSSWLATLDPCNAVGIPAWFQKGSLPTPSPSLPLILVGPGTGCAPFRGFIEERALQSKTISTAPIMFFFGCWNEDGDFLYKDLWLNHSQNNGVLSEANGGGFYVAFSRDQPEKVYVQHKMKEHSGRVCKSLPLSAYQYLNYFIHFLPSKFLNFRTMFEMLLLYLLPLLFLTLPILFFLTKPNKKSSTKKNSTIPKSYPLIGSYLSIRNVGNRRIQWLSDIVQIAPSATFNLNRPLGTRQIITGNPSTVQHILKNQFTNYQKGTIFTKTLSDFLGNGIFNTNGENWKFQRQVASHEFNTKSLRKFVEDVVDTELTNRLIPILSSSTQTKQILDFQDILQRFTFDNICKIAFGFDPEYLTLSSKRTKFAQAFEDATEISSRRFRLPLPVIWKMKKRFNIGSEKRLREAVTEIREFANKIVREKKKELKENNSLHTQDMLSRFLSSGHSEEDFVTDIVISFILAGKDTTSAALTWFFWLLWKNPRVEEEILKEINEKSESLDYDEVKTMVYTHAALSESMRLYPPVPMDSKEAINNDVLPDGTVVKKGTMITYHVYAMGRMRSLWGEDWAEFRPERWLENDGYGKRAFVPRDPFTYPVFQAGPRICLGKEMAFMQMKRIVAGIVGKFKVVPEPHLAEHPNFISFLSSQMEGGFPVTINKRIS